jgi:MinD-like ATPase involved in chromosome partitioning or flagellar assembly/capsular polysaccharide biosynthesis protein
MNSEADLDLRSLGSAVRRYWPWILVVAVAAGAAGFARSGQVKRTYEATALVEIVDPLSSGQSGRLPNLDEIAARRQSVAVLFESPTVFSSVRRSLGDDGSRLRSISARPPNDDLTSIVSVTVIADTSAIAMKAADAAVVIGGDVRRQRADAESKPTLDRLADDVLAVDAQVTELNGRIKALDKSAAASSILGYVAPATEPTLAQLEAQQAARQQTDEAALSRRQLTSLLDQKAVLGDQIRDLTLATNSQSVAFRSYQQAVAAVSAESNRMQTALLIGLGALILALGIAYVVAYTDGRLHHRSDAEAARLGVALLGSQSLTRDRARNTHRLAVGSDRASTAISLLNQREGRQIALGVMAADNDCDLAFDLAITFARSGRRVVLVDANLRRKFDADRPRPTGLAEFLQHTSSLTESLVAGDPIGSGTLKVLPAGGLCSDPVAELNPTMVGELMHSLQQENDCIVVALASALSAPEMLTLMARLDSVILAGRVDVTSRGEMAGLKVAADTVGTPIDGLMVLVQTPRRHRHRFHHYVAEMSLKRAVSSVEASVEAAAEVEAVTSPSPAKSPQRSNTRRKTTTVDVAGVADQAEANRATAAHAGPS